MASSRPALLIASMAWARLRAICSVRSRAVWLFVSSRDGGMRVVSYPSRIWLGDRPVVVFLRLLWTAVAIGSQTDQSAGWLEVTRRRYCSIHWFFRSDRPSVWGWKAVDRFCWIPSRMFSAFPKCDVKRGARSVINLVGSPNHRD